MVSDASFSYTEYGFGYATQDVMMLAEEGQRVSDAFVPSYRRHEGLPRVGIQSGHWLVEEVPDELSMLKKNGAGAVWRTYNERDVIFPIAQKVTMRLAEHGVAADLLPVTVPVGYVADAFVSLHADSNGNPHTSGFKVVSSGYDKSARAERLATLLRREYEKTTGLSWDIAITGHMTGYYAFNWERFEHTVHPMTPSVILEVGYLTSEYDRYLMVEETERIVDGIVRGIMTFLAEEFSTRQTRTLHALFPRYNTVWRMPHY